MKLSQVTIIKALSFTLINLLVLWACAPVNKTKSNAITQTSAPAPAESGDQTAAASSSTGNGATAGTSSSASELRLTLPSYCVATLSDSQQCFKCERQDGGVSIPYEQCFAPAESFQVTRDCSFSDDILKSISCAGTKSGETFTMDVSLAKEKLTAALPAFLIALDLSARQKFPNRPDVTAFTSEISLFLGSRFAQIVKGEDLDHIAGDLLLLANRHLKSPLSQDQGKFFKATAIEGFAYMAKDLSGTKDYNLVKIIMRGIAIAKSIPSPLLGEAAPYLSGPGLAEILSEDKAQSLIKSLGALPLSILGIKSVDDLIAALKNS
jgi:hypothetical protein